MDALTAILSRNLPTPVQEIFEPPFRQANIQLFLKRDDLIHPEVSGNKWRKIKYNLPEAVQRGQKTILTFGGAFSNHIAATAAACQLAGLQSIGIIRGEELSKSANPTLLRATEQNMLLKFISRESYRKRNDKEFQESLHKEFGDFYLIPEGGANSLGRKGCEEIMDEVREHFDIICVACGTGTTARGIISALKPNQKVIVFSALKNNAHSEREFCPSGSDTSAGAFQYISDFHFGGFAKHTPELLQFIKHFRAKHSVELDFIYTAKMLFGIYALIQKGFFRRGTKILAIHTGGIQGNQSLQNI